MSDKIKKNITSERVISAISVKRVTCIDGTTICVEGGASYSSWRCPILVYYVTQNRTKVLIKLWRHQNEVSVSSDISGLSLSASINGNDIRISGIGDWGDGFAIGIM